MNGQSQQTRGRLAWLLAAAILLALVAGVIADAHAQTGPTLYVVIAIDTENGDISWYPGQPLDTDPHPLFDTHNFKPSDPEYSTIFSAAFRNSRQDPAGTPFKMSWFAEMDRQFDAATYLDESPLYPELTGKPVGYTGLRDTLLRYWTPQIAQYGDGVYWHHHVQAWNGSIWVADDAAINGYTHQFDSLNHMILDRGFFPSVYRAGWLWEDSTMNTFLNDWLPFDFSASSGNWTPYHPNTGNPWSSSSPNLARWMNQCNGGDVNPAFQQARDTGAAIYCYYFHDREAMPDIVDGVHQALVAAAPNYMTVQWRYVNALEAMQGFLALSDHTPPTLNITRVTSGTYQIASNEAVWQNRPYVVAKYAGTQGEHYERPTPTVTAANTWQVSAPPTLTLTSATPTLIQYRPVTATASTQHVDGNGWAYNAIDGDTNTWWDSALDLGGGNHGGQVPQWIQVELNGVKPVSRLDIHFYDGDSRTYTYGVEASTDGNIWTQIVPAGTVVHGLATHTFDPATTLRYVRILVTNVTVGSWAHIREIRLYGNLIEVRPAGATASSSGSAYPPTNAVDNNESTWWDSGDAQGGGYQGQVPQWLRADLGQVNNISHFSIRFYDDDTRHYQYWVQASADGIAWTSVVTPAVWGRGTLHHDLAAPMAMRYLQIDVTGGTTGNPNGEFAHIKEVRLYSADPPAPPQVYVLQQVGVGGSDTSGNPSAAVYQREAISLDLSPDPHTVVAGDPVTYTVWAHDSFGIEWDVSTVASLTISSGAGGTWNRNVYTSQVAGDWTVTASYNGQSDIAALTVNGGLPYALTLTALPASQAVGGASTLTASVTDRVGNPVADGTSVTFATDLGGVDSPQTTSNGIAVSLISSAVAGTAHIAAASGAAHGTTTVTFAVPGTAAAINVQITPPNLIAASGATASITATVVDVFGSPVGGVSLSGSVSPSTLGTVTGLGATNASGQALGTWTAGSVVGSGTLSIGNGSLTATLPISIYVPPTVYVVIAIDTENGDICWYPTQECRNDSHPLFDTHHYKHSDAEASTIFSPAFRAAHVDSLGGTFKMSWFAESDYQFEVATYSDESPEYPELTGQPVGYTGIMGALLRYWGTQISQYGDGIYWHHHVQDWTGSSWAMDEAVISGYTRQYETLNHLILDRAYFPSVYRAGWLWEDSNINTFLDDWVPFDFSNSSGNWSTYHPNTGNPWSSSPPNLARWMARCDTGVSQGNVNNAFVEAQSNGTSLYCFYFHDREDMPGNINSVQSALASASASYPGIRFKYVSALDGIQSYLQFTDRTPPAWNISRLNASTFQVTSNEPVWKNTPYITARYTNADSAHEEHLVAAWAGSNTWQVTVPSQIDVTVPPSPPPQYYPVTVVASGEHGSNVAANAVDGNTSTYWDSAIDLPGGGHGGQVPAWIQLDLAAVETVATLSIQFYEGREYTYGVEASVNGTDWAQIVPAGTVVNGLATHQFDPAVALRYVRITVTHNSVNDWAHIREIWLYGPSSGATTITQTLVLNKVGVGASDLYGNASAAVYQESAPPPLPASFFGEVHLAGNPPSVGDLVQAHLAGVTQPITTAITSASGGTLVYNLDVPGDVIGTPDKEGGIEGEVITFTLNSRVVARATWHSGSHTRLDFYSYHITVQPGWNLVSFNLHPVTTAITDVLASLAGQYDLVYAWEAATQTWLKYDNIPMSTDSLLSLNEAMGFWIHITGPAQALDVAGSTPTTTTIPLVATSGGWNLVGYPASGGRALPDALRDHGVGSDFSLVYAYHAAEVGDVWKLFDPTMPAYFNDLVALSPGWGYWVRVSAAHDWHVEYLTP